MAKFAKKSIRLDRRHYWLGVTSAIRWVRNPVSEEGATQVARFMVGFRGQKLLNDVEMMRQHPIGQRLLEEKPNVQKCLSAENLKYCKQGTFGNAYFEMACQEHISPLFMVGGLAYRDGFFDALDCDDDVLWCLERRMFLHDATHILSNYGTDIAGEGLNILFNAGHSGESRVKRFRTVAGWKVRSSKTSIGKERWIEALDQAFDRGAEAAQCLPESCIPWEELIDLPLVEARAFCGVPPMPSDWSSEGWGEEPTYNEDQATPEQQKFESSLSSMVHQGLDWRDFMRAEEPTREKIRQMIIEGAGLQDVAAAL